MWGLVQSVNSIRLQLYRSLIGQILFFSPGPRAYGRPTWEKRGFLFVFSVKNITLKRKPKETKMEGIFFVSFPELPQLSFYSFFPKMKREGKQKRGNCADKSRLLSAGVPRWIRPGFGKVKWALPIKSQQAKRQELLS